MPVESAADRAVFVNSDEFGIVVCWFGAELSALPQTATLNISTGDGPDIQTREMTLVIVASDLPEDAAQGDTVTVRIERPPEPANDTDYLVRSIDRDGEGMALVRLELDE